MSAYENPYDQVEYHAGTFAKTHPRRLSSVARLFGLSAPQIDGCRVLELGCGDGANLLPMAFHMPSSGFVGVDLAQSPIDAARGRVGRLGLRNIEFRQADVTTLGKDLGQFDYVIAHGLYSWVPDSVRPHILRVIRDLLTEHGVAYVSYNALPGCRLRHLVRELLQYRFGQDAYDPKRLHEVRAFLGEFGAIEGGARNTHLPVLKNEIDFVQKIPDFVLFHDDLAPHSSAFYFHEFVAQSRQFELQYLGEATIHEMFTLAGYDEFELALKRWSDDDWIAREQYLDFCKGTRFRQTLLCRAHHRLQRGIGADSLLQFHLRCMLLPAGPDSMLMTADVLKFGGTQQSIELSEPIAKVAIAHLGRLYPQTIEFDALFDAALGACARAGRSYDRHTAHTATLRLLWALVRADQIELLSEPVAIADANPLKPQISALVADALARGESLTGSLHRRFELEDQQARELALAMDGTRTIQQLCDSLPHDPSVGAPAQARQRVDGLVTFLVRQGALAGT